MTIIIIFLNNLSEKNLTVSIITLTLSTNIVNVIIIDINIYYLLYKLKKAQIFPILIKNLKF